MEADLVFISPTETLAKAYVDVDELPRAEELAAKLETADHVEVLAYAMVNSYRHKRDNDGDRLELKMRNVIQSELSPEDDAPAVRHMLIAKVQLTPPEHVREQAAAIRAQAGSIYTDSAIADGIFAMWKRGDYSGCVVSRPALLDCDMSNPLVIGAWADVGVAQARGGWMTDATTTKNRLPAVPMKLWLISELIGIARQKGDTTNVQTLVEEAKSVADAAVSSNQGLKAAVTRELGRVFARAGMETAATELASQIQAENRDSADHDAADIHFTLAGELARLSVMAKDDSEQRKLAERSVKAFEMAFGLLRPLDDWLEGDQLCDAVANITRHSASDVIAAIRDRAATSSPDEQAYICLGQAIRGTKRK